MQRYILWRLMHGVGVLAAVLLMVFLVFYVLADPADHLLPPDVTEEQRQAFRDARGFSDPMHEQFWRFALGAIRLDFGESYFIRTDAITPVLDALPRTVILGSVAFAIAISIGGLIGGISGAFHGGRVDRILTLYMTIVASLPGFWIGLLLMLLFAVKLGLLETGGYGIDRRLIMPAITLAAHNTGTIGLVTRAAVMNIMSEQYVTVARAKGLSEVNVLWRHVARNAAIPFVAIGGLEFTSMVVGGAIIVETIFAWPGIGRLYVTGMTRFDLPLVSAIVFIGTSFIVLLNIVLDILYAYLDPRVRYVD